MSAHYCALAPDDPVHASYHATEYGFPVSNEAELFERLTLEINQAGLSWAIILRKRDGFRRAFVNFDTDTVARFGTGDRERLLGDPAIIRNRRKIDATIENARRIVALRDSHGGFAGWLRSFHPQTGEEWTRLFRKTFLFTGPLVTEEFLLSTGFLPGAHSHTCPVFEIVCAARPPWLEAGLEHVERP